MSQQTAAQQQNHQLSSVHADVVLVELGSGTCWKGGIPVKEMPGAMWYLY